MSLANAAAGTNMTDMRSERRSLVLGAIVADLVAAALFAAFTYVTDKSGLQGLDYFFVLLLVGLAYSFIAICVFALPLFFVLRRLKAINWATSIAAGFFIGAAMAALTAWPQNGLTDIVRMNIEDGSVLRVWVFAAIGGVSALAFLIVTRASLASRGH
jgi:hypothetical protein